MSKSEDHLKKSAIKHHLIAQSQYKTEKEALKHKLVYDPTTEADGPVKSDRTINMLCCAFTKCELLFMD